MNKNEIEFLANELMNEHLSDYPGWTFKFNNRITAIGLCDYGKREISFSKHFIEMEESKINNTILHEIAHVLTRGHGHDYEWKRVARSIGCNANRTTESGIIIKGKYKYVCPSCGEVQYMHRKKKRSFSCVKCNPSRYDERYKFELVEE